MQYVDHDNRKVLADALGLIETEVPSSASINTFEAWSSIGHMRLVQHIEAIINRKLETEEILQIVDLDGISGILMSERAKARTSQVVVE
jgi:hypothetical protein